MAAETLTFLSAEWCEALNGLLSQGRRPVRTPEVDARMIVEASGDVDGDVTLAFTGTDGIPRVERLPEGADTAALEAHARLQIPSSLLRSILLDGDFEAAHTGWTSGDLTTDGDPEVLLYYLYHLYPGGPEGAATMASAVRVFTA